MIEFFILVAQLCIDLFVIIIIVFIARRELNKYLLVVKEVPEKPELPTSLKTSPNKFS